MTLFDQPHIDAALRGLLLAALALAWVVLLVRINGLRSFSKMTNFDFVATVAVGSLLAGAAQSTGWPGLVQASAAMAGLFLVQRAVASIRKRSDGFEEAMQNEPILLMRDGQVFEDALAESRVARGDLIAKLREANVLDMSEVRAVVLETTGDISVLHGDKCAEELLVGVRGA